MANFPKNMTAIRSIQAEQGVVDAFRDYYQIFSKAKGSTGHSFSVGARDKLVAGDYIFVADSHFTLVEFKWSRGGLKEERAKKISNLICPALAIPENDMMLSLARKCHRIAWANGSKVELGVYFDIVCKREKQLTLAKDFCSEWFDPPPAHRASYEEFQAYIDWLLTLSNASQNELLLIGGNYVQEDNDLPDLFLGQFCGIKELKEWLDKNQPNPPTQRYRASERP